MPSNADLQTTFSSKHLFMKTFWSAQGVDSANSIYVCPHGNQKLHLWCGCWEGKFRMSLWMFFCCGGGGGIGLMNFLKWTLNRESVISEILMHIWQTWCSCILLVDSDFAKENKEQTYFLDFVINFLFSPRVVVAHWDQYARGILINFLGIV